jgi:hypothetical protein
MLHRVKQVQDRLAEPSQPTLAGPTVERPTHALSLAPEPEPEPAPFLTAPDPEAPVSSPSPAEPTGAIVSRR